MKKFLSVILVFLFSIIYSQSVGDYLSIGSGAWTGNNVWSVYDGATYQNITDTSSGVDINGTVYYYPGSPASSTSKVVIAAGHNITSGAGTYNIGDLTIKGTLSISGNFSLPSTKNVLVDDGNTAAPNPLITWTANGTFTLPANTSIVLKSGGQISASPCNANQKLQIGTVLYLQCSGGTPYATFDQVNTNGGTLNAVPKAVPTSINPGETVALSYDKTGYIKGTPVTYTWSGTGPGGYTYNYTSTEPPLTAISQNITLTTIGAYTFTLTVSDGTLSDSASVIVGVNNCTSSITASADNYWAVYHSGAAYNANTGTYYAWGQNMPRQNPGTNESTEVLEINSGSPYFIPGTVKKVSGGSSGDGSNQLVVLSSDGKIYGRGTSDVVIQTVNSMGNAVAPLDLPYKYDPVTQTTSTTVRVAASDVTSFWASYKTIAIVANGIGYVYSSEADKNATQGQGGTGTPAWSTAIKDYNGTVITNFVQIRGDASDTGKAGLIGFTSGNELYVWGSNLPTAPGMPATIANTGAIKLTKPAAMTGTIVLVQSNFANTGGITWYFLTNTKQLWAVGANNVKQLGDFSTVASSATWVRVKKDATTDANVNYFSTEEHDATNDNLASVIMILDDKSAYSFGSNGNGLLGTNQSQSTASDMHPTLAVNSNSQTYNGDPTNTERQAKFVEVGGHISFIVAESGKICGSGHGTAGSVLGTSADTYRFQQCPATPVASCPAIVNAAPPTATNDTFTVAQGNNTTSVLGNDKSSSGVTATTSNVNLTWVTTAPTGFTLNNDGTITVGSTALVGTYQITYKICDTVNTTSCATAVATVTVTPCGPTEVATTYGINTTKSDPYSTNLGTKVIYDVSSANATAEVKLTTGNNVGYNGIAYNYNGTNTAFGASTGGYNTSGTTFTNKSIRIQGVSLTGAGNFNDVLEYTIDPQNVSANYTAQVTLRQLVQDATAGGNNEGSDYTVSWTGGIGNAALTDERTTSSTDYGYTPPATWTNDKEVEGNATSVANNGTFRVYAMKNSGVAWSLKFPVGATAIKITKKALNGGTTSSAGIDSKYPALGYNVVGAAPGVNSPGETYAEWMTLTVDLLKTTCACYKDAATGTGLPTTHGITALGRAGKSATATQGNASATQPDNWPMVRTGAWTALEAKTKGFVLNRMPTATAAQVTTTPALKLGEPVNAAGTAAVIANPVKGMMFYDTTLNCLKINSDGTSSGWKCYTTQGCPTVTQ